MPDPISTPIDFLICGTQKGGTSALDAYCRLHHDLDMADTKEVHFFDQDTLFESGAPDYREYHAHFPQPGQGKLRGESTPIYMYWPGAAERIQTYNPDIRLIVILRNPVERAYSHWQMEFHRGLERMPFGEAIRQESARLQEADADYRRVFSYVDRGRYVHQLETLWSLFGRDKVLVLLNEDLRASPAVELEKVSNFLGIAPFPLVAAQTVNAQDYDSPIPVGDRDWLYAIFEAEITNLEIQLGRKLEYWHHHG